MEFSNEPSDEPRKPGRRWPGVVLSVCVPGFGLYRAGRVGRAVVWFGAWQLISLLVGLAFALEFVPVPVAYGLLVASFVVFIWMLCDSFKEGRMTLGKSGLFAGLLAAIALLPAPAKWVVRPFKIPTGAMEPTLRGPHKGPDGAFSPADHVMASRIAYLYKPVQRGDIVAFETRGMKGVPQNLIYIKRIVGLPGETISIKEGSIYVNGRKMDESDGLPPICYEVPQVKSDPLLAMDNAPYQIPEDTFFALGDNSVNSFDSRFWGGVPAANICGKCTKIFYPFHRLGKPTFTPP